MYLSGLDLCTERLFTYRVPFHVFPPTVVSRKEEKVVNIMLPKSWGYFLRNSWLSRSDYRMTQDTTDELTFLDQSTCLRQVWRTREIRCTFDINVNSWNNVSRGRTIELSEERKPVGTWSGPRIPHWKSYRSPSTDLMWPGVSRECLLNPQWYEVDLTTL